MACLAAHPETPMTSEQVANATVIPPGYLNKVFQQLGRAGLVNAQRGPNGGFRLARSLDRINLLDVITSVEPLRRIEKCPLDKPEHLQLCPLHRRLVDAVATVEEIFAGTTLRQLADEINGNGRACQFPGSPFASTTLTIDKS